MKKDIFVQSIAQNKKTVMLYLTLILFLITLPCTIFAQTENEPEVTQNQNGTELSAEITPNQDEPENLPKATIADSGVPSILVVTAGPLGILNTKKNSAPSPILFSIGAGAQIKLAKNISFTPHGQFFGTYYLWENGQALPAELEHRTAYVPSIMVDIPVTCDIYAGNSIFRIGLGASLLLRFAARASDVPTSEKSSIDEMNKWLWQNGRFFYPSAQLSWDYVLDNGAAVGLGAKAYFSLGGFLDGDKLDRSMIMLSVRLVPPVW